MSDLNRVVVTGRLTRDAEKKATASGMAVVRFSLANGYRKKDGDQWKDETNYFDCVFIGSRADSLLQYLKKGRQVAIDGELRQSRWEKDGQNYSKVEVLVEDLQLLAAPQGSEQKPQANTQSKPASSGPETFNDDDDDVIPF